MSLAGAAPFEYVPFIDTTNRPTFPPVQIIPDLVTNDCCVNPDSIETERLPSTDSAQVLPISIRSDPEPAGVV